MTLRRVYQDVDEFNSYVIKQAHGIPREALEKLLRWLILEGLRRLVMKTPVGNPDLWKNKPPKGYVGGRARGNWQVTVTVDVPQATNRIDKEGDETIARAAAKIAKVVGTNPYRLFFVSNTVPYIEPLENGHSTQAAGGMLALTFEELKHAFSGYDERTDEVK